MEPITKEIQFRRQLAEALSQPPYNHKVFFHENPNEFSVHGARGWVDLYIQTNPKWRYHHLFPAIGIETKVAKGLGWLIDAIEQVGKYDTDLKQAIYTINGKRVPTPSLFMVATPESWAEGHLYRWMPPEFQSTSPTLETPEVEAMRYGSWFTLTFVFERLLMRHGATVLRREGVFYTNRNGNHGAVTKYSLTMEYG